MKTIGLPKASSAFHQVSIESNIITALEKNNNTKNSVIQIILNLFKESQEEAVCNKTLVRR